jgi:SAM-dependent methyltransferase
LTAGESTPADHDLRHERSSVRQTFVSSDLESFKAGHTALRPLQIAELGDVAAKTLLHLQCRCGLETLSWARLGAEVTGVDPSPEAIAVARRLAAQTGLRATFIESDVCEIERKLQREFDIVFVSWGALARLRDLERWADTVARYLEPGGTFYLTEVHPFAQMLEETGDRDVRVDYPYLSGPEPSQHPARGPDAQPEPQARDDPLRGCPHSFAEIFNSLIGAGLRIEFLHEFPFSAAPLWEWMERDQDGWFRLPGRRDDIPLACSLKATRPLGGA